MASLWGLLKADDAEHDAALGRELAGEEGMPPKTEAQVADNWIFGQLDNCIIA